MQIVIDIDENVYTRLFDNGIEDYAIINDDLFAIAKSIRKGIPLPKGHGRLIDADAVNKKMGEREKKLQDDRSMWESSAVSTALDMYAPTIIEADMAESEV